MKRVLSLVMALVMLITALAVAPIGVSADAATMPMLAFVPLDNRPVCTDRVIYQARSAGFDIQLPAEDLYRTYLDNQGVNANGTQHGDGTKIMDWLEQMDKQGCDHFVIHLDQMFSGGLVGSRYPDTTAVTSVESNIIDRLIVLTNDGNNQVYFVDTVMRLASTSEYKGYVLGEYTAFRDYAEKPRKQLNTADFYTSDYNTSVGQLDAIVAGYQTGPSGEWISFYTGERTDWWAPLTQDMINEYHAFRRRKLDLLNLLMQFGNRRAHYIIGVDDSSPNVTIQTNEINFINARMETLGYDYYLFADTDSAGMMAVARCTTDYYAANPKVKVRYYGNKADEAGDQYDIGTLRTNVATHVESANADVVDSGADVELLVLTKADTTVRDAGGEVTSYTQNILSLIEQAQYNLDHDIPTIIADCSTGDNYMMAAVYGYTNLQDALLENLDVTRLLGYSNWNTVGNTLGISIGQGLARYAYLANADVISSDSHVAFVQGMTHAYIKDITYIARQKHTETPYTFQWWLNNTVGGTGWNNGNFYAQMMAYTDDSDYKLDWELCRGERVVNNGVEWYIMMNRDPADYNGCGQQVLNAVMAGTVYTDLQGAPATVPVGNVSLSRFRFPWYRSFEMTFDIAVTVGSFSTEGELLHGVPVGMTLSKFFPEAAAQFGAQTVTVSKWDGTAPDQSDIMFTGCKVTVDLANNVQHSYYLVIKGDVCGQDTLGGDGVVNTADAREVLRYSLGMLTFSDAQIAASDMDGSATINTADAREVLRYSLGM